MAKAIIFHEDLSIDIMNKVGVKHMKLSGKLPLAVHIDIQDAKKAASLGKDPLLKAELTQVFTPKIKTVKAALIKDIKETDAICGKLTQDKMRKERTAAFEKEAKKKIAAFAKVANAPAQKAWDNYVTKMKLGHEYNKKVGIALITQTFNIGFSAVKGALGTAPTGGLLLVYEIRKTAISIAKIATEIDALSKSADEYGEGVNASITKLLNAYKKNSKEMDNKAAAKDTGKKTVNAILGFDAFKTIDSTIKDNDRFIGKLNAAYEKAHNLSEDLQKVLEKNEEALETNEVLASPKATQLLKKQEKTIRTLLTRIPKLSKSSTDGEKKAKANDVVLKNLKKEMPQAWKTVQSSLVLVEVVIAGGDFSDPAKSLSNMAQEAYKQVQSDTKKSAA